jgi:chitinase
MDAATNGKRARGLKKAQDAKGIQVAFTLAAFPRDKWGTPGGMTAASLDVVKAAVAAGVRISHVNLMTMDYGGYYSTGYKMGDLAVSAVNDAATQLKGAIPGLTDDAAYAMLGATPMIGRNDVSSETFTLDDARTLVAFARSKKLGLLAFWAINRDQPGSSLALSSMVNTTNFEFNDVFKTAL